MSNDMESVLVRLKPIQDKISKSESESILDRWEFGSELLKHRVGEQLPRGLLARVTNEYGVSRSEIHRRMQLAEKFKSKTQVSHAWDKYGSWRQIVSKALPKRDAAPKPAWDERISKRLDRIIDDVETEDQFKTLAELLRKALDRVEPSQDAKS